MWTATANAIITTAIPGLINPPAVPAAVGAAGPGAGALAAAIAAAGAAPGGVLAAPIAGALPVPPAVVVPPPPVVPAVPAGIMVPAMVAPPGAPPGPGRWLVAAGEAGIEVGDEVLSEVEGPEDGQPRYLLGEPSQLVPSEVQVLNRVRLG